MHVDLEKIKKLPPDVRKDFYNMYLMYGEKKMDDIILISGGFDPVHSGHIFLIKEAAKYGDVVVLLNSD